MALDFAIHRFLNIFDYEDHAHHCAVPRDWHLYTQTKVTGTCLHYFLTTTAVFVFLLTPLTKIVKHQISSSSCTQRLWSRTPSTAGHPPTSTSRGTKSLARRALLLLLLMTSTSLNPNAAPWWPEGYDGAGPSCELSTVTSQATPDGERLQHNPVRSTRKKAFRRAMHTRPVKLDTEVVCIHSRV